MISSTMEEHGTELFVSSVHLAADLAGALRDRIFCGHSLLQGLDFTCEYTFVDVAMLFIIARDEREYLMLSILKMWVFVFLSLQGF